MAARNRTGRRDTGNARSGALVERRESGRMLEGRVRHREWRLRDCWRYGEEERVLGRWLYVCTNREAKEAVLLCYRG